MANAAYELGGKMFLKCKEWGCFKEINNENRYFHSLGYLGVLSRCKECIKKGRTFERERIMARKRDYDRYHNDENRNAYIKKTAVERTKRKGYGYIHEKTRKKIRKLGIRPNICPICLRKGRIIAHHPDYDKRYENCVLLPYMSFKNSSLIC